MPRPLLFFSAVEGDIGERKVHDVANKSEVNGCTTLPYLTLLLPITPRDVFVPQGNACLGTRREAWRLFSYHTAPYLTLSSSIPTLHTHHSHRAVPMASSRIFSSRFIYQRAATDCKHQFRRLHITGANAAPSPLLSSETTGAYVPRTITDLKTECMNRSLKIHGSKAEVR